MVYACNPSTGCGSEIGSCLPGAYCLASLDEMVSARCSERTCLKKPSKEWMRKTWPAHIHIHVYTLACTRAHTHTNTHVHAHTCTQRDLKEGLVQFFLSLLTNVLQWLIHDVCPLRVSHGREPLAWTWGVWFLVESVCFISDGGMIVFHKLPTTWEVLNTGCSAIQGAETVGKGRAQKWTWKWIPSCDQK